VSLREEISWEASSVSRDLLACLPQGVFSIFMAFHARSCVSYRDLSPSLRLSQSILNLGKEHADARRTRRGSGTFRCITRRKYSATNLHFNIPGVNSIRALIRLRPISYDSRGRYFWILAATRRLNLRVSDPETLDPLGSSCSIWSICEDSESVFG